MASHHCFVSSLLRQKSHSFSVLCLLYLDTVLYLFIFLMAAKLFCGFAGFLQHPFHRLWPGPFLLSADQ